MTNNKFDDVIEAIADYTLQDNVGDQESLSVAKDVIMDSMGCAILSLNYEACTKLLGPIVPMNIEVGSKVPGTSYYLDPVQGSLFRNHDSMVRL